MSATAASARTSPIVAARLPRAGVIAAAIASVANVIVYFVTAALGVDMTGPFAGGPTGPIITLPVVAVVLATIVPTIGAALLLWLLGRFTQRAVTVFIAIAVVFGLLSFAGPLGLPISPALQLSLNLMHVIAGVIITYVLVMQTRRS